MLKKDAALKSLVDSVEDYSKTSFELLKLKYVERKADLTSSFVTKALFVVVLSLLAINLNIALALYFGTYFSRNFYVFLVVSSFYGLLSIILLFAHKLIKTKVKDSIVADELNEN